MARRRGTLPLDRAWRWLSAQLGRPLPHGPAELPVHPRLLVLDAQPPQAFPLHGRGPWWVGRGARAHVRIEDDPHVSRHHLRLRRDGTGRFTVEAAAAATNPATLNYQALPPGMPVALPPGAVLAAGRTRFVFQPGTTARPGGSGGGADVAAAEARTEGRAGEPTAASSAPRSSGAEA